MTLMELQNILGETLKEIHDAKGGSRDATHAFEKAEYEAKIAKQLINNADVILRTDKLCNKNNRIDEIVGK